MVPRPVRLRARIREVDVESRRQAAISAVMRANKKRDTGPEIALRSALHRAGLRFRKDYPVRPDAGRVVRVDIAFPRSRLAVFVDGCFWHSCSEHGTRPQSNRQYWEPKLARNVQRDRETEDRLARAGWTVVRVWEHEQVPDAVGRVRSALFG